MHELFELLVLESDRFDLFVPFGFDRVGVAPSRDQPGDPVGFCTGLGEFRSQLRSQHVGRVAQCFQCFDLLFQRGTIAERLIEPALKLGVDPFEFDRVVGLGFFAIASVPEVTSGQCGSDECEESERDSLSEESGEECCGGDAAG